MFILLTRRCYKVFTVSGRINSVRERQLRGAPCLRVYLRLLLKNACEFRCHVRFSLSEKAMSFSALTKSSKVCSRECENCDLAWGMWGTSLRRIYSRPAQAPGRDSDTFNLCWFCKYWRQGEFLWFVRFWRDCFMSVVFFYYESRLFLFRTTFWSLACVRGLCSRKS